MTGTTTIEITRELDSRSSNGIDVRLLWAPGRDEIVFVEVVDTSSAEAFTVEVPASQALDAFRHPYAYAAAQRIPFGSAARTEETADVL